MMMMSSMYQVAVHSDVFYDAILVQHCGSIGNPAARMIRAATLSSRFKCSSSACGEIGGVMESSEKIRNSKKYSSTDLVVWMLLRAGCSLALVALMA